MVPFCLVERPIRHCMRIPTLRVKIKIDKSASSSIRWRDARSSRNDYDKISPVKDNLSGRWASFSRFFPTRFTSNGKNEKKNRDGPESLRGHIRCKGVGCVRASCRWLALETCWSKNSTAQHAKTSSYQKNVGEKIKKEIGDWPV